MAEEVERETVMPASPEEAWAALIESDWLEPVLDGSGGFLEEADAPHRLSFWWGAEGEESTRVEITLEEVGREHAEEGTLVRVVESRPLQVLDAYGDDLGAAIGTRSGGPQALAASTRLGQVRADGALLNVG